MRKVHDPGRRVPVPPTSGSLRGCAFAVAIRFLARSPRWKLRAPYAIALRNAMASSQRRCVRERASSASKCVMRPLVKFIEWAIGTTTSGSIGQCMPMHAH